MTIMLLIHLLATVFMTGLAWFVQVVHYPLMGLMDGQLLVRYAQAHRERTSWVALPVMTAEVCSAAALVYMIGQVGQPPEFFLSCLSAVLLMGIWLATGLAMMPCHRCLARRGDRQVLGQLVQGNWLRTVLWTVRSALAVVLLVQGTGG